MEQVKQALFVTTNIHFVFLFSCFLMKAWPQLWRTCLTLTLTIKSYKKLLLRLCRNMASLSESHKLLYHWLKSKQGMPTLVCLCLKTVTDKSVIYHMFYRQVSNIPRFMYICFILLFTWLSTTFAVECSERWVFHLERIVPSFKLCSQGSMIAITMFFF